MGNKEKTGQRAHYLIDTAIAARELRSLGEVMRGETLSNYFSESGMTRRFEDALAGREWIRQRAVPTQAKMAGYWWACTGEGDKKGLSYEKLKEVEEDLNIGLLLSIPAAEKMAEGIRQLIKRMEK